MTKVKSCTRNAMSTNVWSKVAEKLNFLQNGISKYFFLLLSNSHVKYRKTLILENCILSSEADENFINFSGRGLGESPF